MVMVMVQRGGMVLQMIEGMVEGEEIDMKRVMMVMMMEQMTSILHQRKINILPIDDRNI